jgi:phosphoenolpyruvate synthase/pyruvate phosphate dikinase
MAKIRTLFRTEIEALLPVLHETYRRVGVFQKNRTGRHEGSLQSQLELVGERLAIFVEYLQPTKQAYYHALRDTSLSISDRIVALDTFVGMMHIEFAMERAYMHAESPALRRVLEQSRQSVDDVVSVGDDSVDGLLVRGIPASPGAATGKAALIRRNSDYRRLPANSVVVAHMTRPELIMGIERIAAIVTDIGGSLCHAAIIARERGIPCVVGTEKATQVIRSKTMVTVDGTSGEVTRAL